MATNEIKQIKDLKIALKDMEPYVKNPIFLTQGKRFSNFNMLVREAWANWLLCVVIGKITKVQHTFRETIDGDGLIVNRSTQVTFPVEHVCAMDFPAGRKLPSGEDRIIWAIDHKIGRGLEYAEGKSLVVFFDGAGLFYRNKIRENILGRHNFKVVFCVGLLESSEKGYSYTVTEFRDSFKKQSITHRVDINADFTDWSISQVMA